MKAITLYQPWASLVALRAKKYETRSWRTSHRGMLAIHAAKTTKYMHLMDTEPFASALFIPEGLLTLPTGVIIAIVKLVGIISTDKRGIISHLGNDELSFGDFSPGRWAWELELKTTFECPIPARGKQGLWDWEIPSGV